MIYMNQNSLHFLVNLLGNLTFFFVLVMMNHGFIEALSVFLAFKDLNQLLIMLNSRSQILNYYYYQLFLIFLVYNNPHFEKFKAVLSLT